MSLPPRSKVTVSNSQKLQHRCQRAAYLRPRHWKANLIFRYYQFCEDGHGFWLRPELLPHSASLVITTCNTSIRPIKYFIPSLPSAPLTPRSRVIFQWTAVLSPWKVVAGDTGISTPRKRAAEKTVDMLVPSTTRTSPKGSKTSKTSNRMRVPAARSSRPLYARHTYLARKHSSAKLCSIGDSRLLSPARGPRRDCRISMLSSAPWSASAEYRPADSRCRLCAVSFYFSCRWRRPAPGVGPVAQSRSNIPGGAASNRQPQIDEVHKSLRIRSRVSHTKPSDQCDNGNRPAPMPALGGASAQPLRFLDFLIHQPVRAVMLHAAGIPVLVPTPERYAIHKLIVGSRRRIDADGTGKSRKDRLQSRTLMEAMLGSRQGDALADAYMEAWDRGNAWKEAIMESMRSYEESTRVFIAGSVGEAVASLGAKPKDYGLS